MSNKQEKQERKALIKRIHDTKGIHKAILKASETEVLKRLDNLENGLFTSSDRFSHIPRKSDFQCAVADIDEGALTMGNSAIVAGAVLSYISLNPVGIFKEYKPCAMAAGIMGAVFFVLGGIFVFQGVMSRLDLKKNIQKIVKDDAKELKAKVDEIEAKIASTSTDEALSQNAQNDHDDDDKENE